MGGGAGQVGAAVAAGRQAPWSGRGSGGCCHPRDTRPSRRGQAPSSSMIRSSAKYSTKNSTSVLEGLLIQRVQGWRGRCGRRRRRRGWPGSCRIPACGPPNGRWVDAAVLGAAERDAEMLQLVDRRHPPRGTCIRCCPGRPASLTPSRCHTCASASHPRPCCQAPRRCRPWAATVWERVGNTLVMHAVFSPGRAHAQGGAQPSAAGTDHHHVIGVVDDLVGAVGRLGDRVHN